MYFSKQGTEPERWKSLMVDQDKQRAEVAIGLGGNSSCSWSEARTIVDPTAYMARVAAGLVPLASATGLDHEGRVARAIRMALSTCQPLDDRIHRGRFPGSSLFDDRWRPIFESLCRRGLMLMDRCNERISLTAEGRTLVEAIINT